MGLLNSQDWRRLIESIRRRKCILVLGPRAAVDLHSADADPLSLQLARKLSDGLIHQDSRTDITNLSQVAQHYQNEYERLDLEIAIQDFFEPFSDSVPDLHRSLAALPFPLCINLFYDRFMWNALAKQEDKTPAYDYYHFREVRAAGAEPDTQAPLVFNLFGDARDPESLVVSETDLLDFLVRVLSRNPPLQSNVTSLLSPEPGKSFTFLFLGMGFQQWHIRILLHALGILKHKQPSLAVEDDAFFEHPDQPASAVFFELQHKIAFRQISVTDFVTELCKRYQQRSGGEPDEQIVIPKGAPKVFLCYRSDDRDEVAAWQQKLHRHGIDSWRDQQDLRGGDNWNQVIRDVLNRQCDYVLVLQTQAMVSAVRTYCNREIGIALDIQQEYGAFKFVIPLRLDDCTGFENLQHIQTQDLKTDADLERLVQTIQADWQLRQQKTQRAQEV